MANTQRPFGLKPVRYFSGAPWTGQARPYYVPAAYATALYLGDPVVITGDSNTTKFQGFNPGTLSEVNIGAAGDGNVITGVFVGINPVTRESTIYRSASVETMIYVVDDPNVIFQIQDDGSGAPDHDWIGLNANLVAGAGSAITGQSGWALNATTPAADASNQLFILALANMMQNDLGDFGIWEVLLNQQTYKPASGLGVA